MDGWMDVDRLMSEIADVQQFYTDDMDIGFVENVGN
jgi:hypothetical protein